MPTTRERIAARLRERAATPSELAESFDVSPSTALEHARHVARSVDDTAEQVLVRPPACRDCGFDGFDDRLNVPSRCPECKSENVAEPAVTIE
jgi:predicted Zn-ribbon and HTH transcriptional regulator